MIKRIIRKAIRLAMSPLMAASLPIKKSVWYNSLFVGADGETYPDNNWYRKHNERNFDLINLGSSGGKWAFDYSDFDIKAMNWAQQPQTLLEDFNLLRNYHSILKKGGVVLITIMPFTGLNKTTSVQDAIKYLKIDAHEPIQPHELQKAKLFVDYPILMGKQAIKAGLKYILGKEQPLDLSKTAYAEKNPMSVEELEKDALRWINGWKRQFNIIDFEAPLTEENQKGRAYRIKLMQKLIDFCLERSYKPVYVIPPVTKHLSKYYTKKFEEIYVYGFLKSVDRDILLLDYSKDEILKADDLYFNSFFLNKRGRRTFTEKILNNSEASFHFL